MEITLQDFKLTLTSPSAACVSGSYCKCKYRGSSTLFLFEPAVTNTAETTQYIAKGIGSSVFTHI